MVSCSSCRNRTPQAYFNRPQLNECITLESGNMTCNGIVQKIPAGLIIPKTIEDYNSAYNYCENKEYRLYECLRFGSCN